jgi:hypothetical protein
MAICSVTDAVKLVAAAVCLDTLSAKLPVHNSTTHAFSSYRDSELGHAISMHVSESTQHTLRNGLHSKIL